MASQGTQRDGPHVAPDSELQQRLPKPTMSFRRRAWLQFQRAIDPLAPPKPFKIQRH